MKKVVKVIVVLILLLITGCGEKERLFIEDIVEKREGQDELSPLSPSKAVRKPLPLLSGSLPL